MRFPAFFDTNVLYGALLNDVVLELADRGLYRPLWSKDVLFELAKNLVKNGEDPRLVEKRVGTMERYFADAMVSGYDDLVPTMTNDEKDRHVLAAAVRGGAEVLVMFNTKDFPPESVEPFDLEIVHPDAFLLDQLDLYRAPTLRALVELVEGYDSPAMTVDDFLLALTRAGVPDFVDAVRSKLY
ncbi:PIN domain-containing protein [Rathayibacter sp. PhB127]|uniref:PIN domain-containing protein n=1 Tax=unclassified Rathayibacter TaxID=2609250 RepID=UPI000F4BD581|nr:MULTISPECIES: PIN domain-containing protein [unclassified Rathayibacter]ROS25730.1 PIN domain-containing protein [Rathayibacter sp. PhB127]TDX77432.1 PIN domain-containing protein [Rathayibacter sp. PhB151]